MPFLTVPAAVRATTASVISLIEPVYAAAAIAVLFLGERLAALAVTEARSAVAAPAAPPAKASAPG
ncbi:hypothetical protein [Streptomyces sp. NPDC048196]|uniref:hypothetical protein n=1 Tax=Streptomyces sp. NPDC048196 TaxID=3154712 RepID=UPI0033F5C4E9